MNNKNILKILGVVSSLAGLLLPLLDDYLAENRTREIVREELQAMKEESTNE